MALRIRSHLLLIFIAALAVWPTVASSQSSGGPERFTASAINPNRAAAGNVEIAIERWSTDAERDRLMGVMLEKGPEKLLDALQDAPRKGYFRAPGNLGWDIHFARRVPLPDGGERIILVTDRPIGFWEATNRPRSVDYPFTVIELRIDRNGRGEGKASLATKIIADEDAKVVTLENYDLQPVQLTNVRRESSTH